MDDMDDMDDNITDVKAVGLGPNDNAIAPCSKSYTPVRYNPLDGQKADIARLFLLKKRLYVLCYAMSPLINPGKLFADVDDISFHSGTFLKASSWTKAWLSQIAPLWETARTA